MSPNFVHEEGLPTACLMQGQRAYATQHLLASRQEKVVSRWIKIPEKGGSAAHRILLPPCFPLSVLICPEVAALNALD